MYVLMAFFLGYFCYGCQLLIIIQLLDFDDVSTKDLVEMVGMLIKLILKIFVDFCGYISTERGFKPDYVLFVVTFVGNFF